LKIEDDNKLYQEDNQNEDSNQIFTINQDKVIEYESMRSFDKNGLNKRNNSYKMDKSRHDSYEQRSKKKSLVWVNNDQLSPWVDYNQD
jgi:hypothetical protein